MIISQLLDRVIRFVSLQFENQYRMLWNMTSFVFPSSKSSDNLPKIIDYHNSKIIISITLDNFEYGFKRECKNIHLFLFSLSLLKSSVSSNPKVYVINKNSQKETDSIELYLRTNLTFFILYIDKQCCILFINISSPMRNWLINLNLYGTQYNWEKNLLKGMFHCRKDDV